MNEIETKASQSNEESTFDDRGVCEANGTDFAEAAYPIESSDELIAVSPEEVLDGLDASCPAEFQEEAISDSPIESQDEAIPENLVEEDPSMDPGAFRHNLELGKRGEDAACAFLIRRGFTILERNWKCPGGEADIIASREGEYGLEIHFVEVKTRMSSAKGFPSEAVDRAKRRRYERISELYFQQSDCSEARVTFDIISILVTGASHAYLRMHRDVLSFDCR